MKKQELSLKQFYQVVEQVRAAGMYSHIMPDGSFFVRNHWIFDRKHYSFECRMRLLNYFFKMNPNFCHDVRPDEILTYQLKQFKLL